jgi:hypothetical protein
MDANSERDATAAEVMAARCVYRDDNVELEINDDTTVIPDDGDTTVIPDDGGVFVKVWLWVTTEEISNDA